MTRSRVGMLQTKRPDQDARSNQFFGFAIVMALTELEGTREQSFSAAPNS
jgi:hypothetical protein